jgi:hypothetical protein
MSSQNSFPGPNAGRQLARPTTPPSNGQPSWVNPQAQPQSGRPQQPGYSWPEQQAAAASHQPQSPSYGQWSELQPNKGAYGGQQQGNAAGGPSDPYAPQFEPYVPPSRPNFRQPSPSFPQPQPAAPGYGAQQPQQPAPQWPARPGEQRGYDTGSYGAQSYPQQQPAPSFGHQQYHENELSAADWAGPHDGFGQDPFQQHQGDQQLGFGHAEGGELEPVYNEEELDYEDEEDAPRSRRGLMIVAALVGAIAIGGGMAYGYKKFTGTMMADASPPVIKSDDTDAKTKPADAGGKQFPYSDSKIMGRLGDGTSTASADESNPAPQSPPPDAAAPDSSTTGSVDEGGARKVSTLVVGRDGTIMPPATPTEDRGSAAPSSGDGAVPGTSLVDVFGQQGGGGRPPSGSDNQSASAQASSPDDSAPAPRAKPAKITTINGAGASDDSADTPPPTKKKFKKVARADPSVETDATADAPPVVSSGGGTGFVAVLASVPHSTSSRIDALKRFADMQQKYSAALSGKTPDIASASLSKGVYDRLVVGPPGSREQASSVCTQLKAEGYKGCWVTSY